MLTNYKHLALCALATFSMASLFTASVVEGATPVKIGFPRYPERDTPDWLAGMYVALHESNNIDPVPGYTFELALAHIPACTSGEWTECVAQATTSGQSFLNDISTMSVVMTPDWWIAEPVIAAAAALKIPVISPKTFGYADTHHTVFLDQRVEGDIPHTVSYMLGAHQCARTGLVVTRYMITLDPVYLMQQVFEYGGYQKPEFIMTNVTDADVLNFILGEDPDRLCFLMLVTLEELWHLTRLLKADPRYSTAKYKFFSFNNIETGKYEVDGDTSVFDNLYLTKHVPTFHEDTVVANRFKASFESWLTSGAAAYDSDAATFLAGEQVPTTPSEAMFFTYITTRYFINTFKVASKPYTCNGQNLATPAVPPQAEILDVSYTNRIYVDGLMYQPLVNRCPDLPLDQLCFCNVAPRTTFMFKVNGTTGRLTQLYDNIEMGQVGVTTSIVPADKCASPELELSNYPIIMTMILPSDGGFSDVTTGITVLLHYLVLVANTQVPAPSRPFRLIAEFFPYDEITDENQAVLNRRTNPFLTAMTMGSSLHKSSSLVMYPNADVQSLEDKPLSQYASGDENILSTLASVADCIHALAGYYSEHVSLFTGIVAFAATDEEAALMVKSLNTFQFDVPVTVEKDSSKWMSVLTALFATSAKPFVLMSAVNNNPLVIAAIDLRSDIANGVLGLACYEGMFLNADYSKAKGDVFFVSILPQWWGSSSLLRQYFLALGIDMSLLGNDPSLYLCALTFGLSSHIAQQAVAASSTAASLLYQTGTLSVAEVIFGPYSNKTCSAKVIATNSRDRDCQCYKGPRTFHLHSLFDFIDASNNNVRTDDYKFSMTTCGVVYMPYIPPPQSSSLSGASVAGIAVAGSTFLLAAILIPVLCVCCFFGRKHWHAPHDSTKPFAMVFTDIQNSTGLWARAPAAMSSSVSLHHELIRKLISKHKGYEVKTIGDSFMVAFKDVNNAASLALDIQSTLFDADWPSEIDANYMELISEAMLSDPKMGVALGTSEEQYLRLWKGIRVRVGVHYGIGDIRKDPVSMGFDYYGTVVNTAARVEGVGHGGQVLLTDEAFGALDPNFISTSEVQIIDLGSQPLRGLDNGVILKQLTPGRFHERQFPPLRLDVEHVVVEGQSNSDISGTETDENITPEQMAQRLASMPGVKTDVDTILTYYHFLNAGFSAAPAKWRHGAIKELGAAWNIEIHKGGVSTMRGLMQLAIKMERAARVRGNRRGSTSNPSASLRVGGVDSVTASNRKVPADLHRQSTMDNFLSVPASPAVIKVDEISPFEVSQNDSMTRETAQ